jgi:plastocyanin
MKARRESIPGSGLPTAALVALLTASVALFLVWNGLLWKAPREASHVMRFVVSYLAVIPLGAAFLLGLRRFTWAHLITSTGVVWAAKLVITAALYQAFARGTATQLQAVAPPPSAILGTAKPTAEYRAATAFAAGTLRGRVTKNGKGVAGAVVFLDTPAPGRAAPAPAKVELRISQSRYDEPLYLAHVDDEVLLVNKDALLHTAHFSGSNNLPATAPTPAGSEPHRVPFTDPGVFRVRCDNHAGEGAWIVVVDHPYVIRTAADGSFSMDGVPAGEVRLAAVAASGLGARRADLRVNVGAGESKTLDLDLDAAREITP